MRLNATKQSSFKSFFFILFLFLTLASIAKAEVDGAYDTLQPERGLNGQPTQQIFMQLTKMSGQDVLVTAGCHPGCTPIIFSYQAEQSKTLGKDVYFSKAGMYILRVSENVFISVIPDAQLGMKAWETLRFVNVYAKQGTNIPFDIEGATHYAIKQSEAIMNTGTLEEMTHGGGVYHIAVPIRAAGKTHQSAELLFSHQTDSEATQTGGVAKSIEVKACERCPSDVYEYASDESAISGTASYLDKRGNVLFDVRDGVLVWANFKGDLGKKKWTDKHYFNVYAKDIGYIRQIRSDKAAQDRTEALVADIAERVKAEMDSRRRAAQRAKELAQTLPQKGMTDQKYEQEATDAANRWAKNWSWKESIEYAYFTSSDWNIQHHPLTGIVTGRFARGIIVMKRDDGMCSFHYASFGQEYDGSNFGLTYMVGLTPGQIKLQCSNI